MKLTLNYLSVLFDAPQDCFAAGSRPEQPGTGEKLESRLVLQLRTRLDTFLHSSKPFSGCGRRLCVEGPVK